MFNLLNDKELICYLDLCHVTEVFIESTTLLYTKLTKTPGVFYGLYYLRNV